MFWIWYVLFWYVYPAICNQFCNPSEIIAIKKLLFMYIGKYLSTENILYFKITVCM